MELSKEETAFIDFYKNYSNNIKNETLSNLDRKWTQNGTKEKNWVNIYQKLPVNPSIESILFIKFDESTVLNELDTLVSKL